jgi:hypothetical protein
MMIMMFGIACSIFLLTTAEAQEKAISPAYDQLMEKLENLTPGEVITIRMGTEKDQYDFGEPFELRFQTDKDCYVMLMTISMSMDVSSGSPSYTPGDITFLLPKHQFPDGKIEGEKVYSTLHDFGLTITAEPPRGFDTINLICSPDKLDLFDTEFSESDPVYAISPDDEEALKDLIARLDLLSKHEWSGNSLMITIGPRSRALPQKHGSLPPIGTTGTAGKFFPPIGTTGTAGKTEENK